MNNRTLATVCVATLVMGPACAAQAATPSSTHSPSRQLATAAYTIGSHVAKIPGVAGLGSPLSSESAWASAGGGYAQRFTNGWALIPSAGLNGPVSGPGAIVVGKFNDTFSANGYVNLVGWPTGASTSDALGSYQHFTAGALVDGPNGVMALKAGIADYYFSPSKARSALGAPLGKEVHWAAGGGGQAQQFERGWLTYQAPAVKGYILSSFSRWPDFVHLGWPTSATYAATCGTNKVNLKYGYATQDGRWCPDASYAQPATSFARATMPGSLTTGDAGVPVYLAQKKLGVGGLSYLIPNKPTWSALRAKFGTPDMTAQTLVKLGYPSSMWSAGTEPTQPTAPLGADQAEHVGKMIKFLEDHRGAPYVYGSAGPVDKYGADCSGLALAGMQAGGVTPKTASVLNDIKAPTKLTAALYNDASLQTVDMGTKKDLSNLKQGDLVFFGMSTSVYPGERTDLVATGIDHTAVYIGNGKFIDTESLNLPAEERTLSQILQPSAGVGQLYRWAKRPFADADAPTGAAKKMNTHSVSSPTDHLGTKHVMIWVNELRLFFPAAMSNDADGAFLVPATLDDSGAYAPLTAGAKVKFTSAKSTRTVAWLGHDGVLSTRTVAACAGDCPTLTAPSGAIGVVVQPVDPMSQIQLASGDEINLSLSDLNVADNRLPNRASSLQPQR